MEIFLEDQRRNRSSATRRIILYKIATPAAKIALPK